MKCGLPVIVSNIPSHRELIRQGHNGLIADNLEDWYKYLKELIQSPSLRKKIGKQAYISQEREYGEEAIAKKYIKLFKYLAENNGNN